MSDAFRDYDPEEPLDTSHQQLTTQIQSLTQFQHPSYTTPLMHRDFFVTYIQPVLVLVFQQLQQILLYHREEILNLRDRVDAQDNGIFTPQMLHVLTLLGEALDQPAVQEAIIQSLGAEKAAELCLALAHSSADGGLYPGDTQEECIAHGQQRLAGFSERIKQAGGIVHASPVLEG